MKRLLAIGLASFATLGLLSTPEFATDSVADTKDWHYAKVNITEVRDGTLILDQGSAQGIYVGSTGMIYVGNTQDFLTDGEDKVRFEIVSVDANSSEAEIFQGTFSQSQLSTNKRAVLRAKNAPVTMANTSDAPQASTTNVGDAPKPRATKPASGRSWCTDRDNCARFCKGGKANSAAVSEMMKKQNLPPPAQMVDPAVAIQPVLEKLGCTPNKSATPAKASINCGIQFLKDKRAVLPGVIPGLAQAALEAKKKGYVLAVGSTYRSLTDQVNMMCENLSEGGLPCGKGTGLACPGPNVHTEGFAVDLHLRRNGKKVTPATGRMEPCSQRTALVKKSKELMDLNDIMFSTGWYKFCQELWHFEYTENPFNGERTKTY